jgi:hypothetical protein
MLSVLSIWSLLALLVGATGAAATVPPWPVWSSLRGACCGVECRDMFAGSGWSCWCSSASLEIAVDGHHWPSAGVGGRMTGGVASSVREIRAGEGARPGG